jgi:rare lipoprotein A
VPWGARRRPQGAFIFVGAALVVALLAGCASGLRDAPPANPPPNLSSVPDADPRIEPIRAGGGTSKPYTVQGRSYVPITDDRPLRERGLASWYGRKFHSQSTASGEPYDMYAMTAAHKTLPLPSYVRVRNPANGREAIVRVNDRGPFVDGRVIDLSYTAALKLDLLRGVAPVEIERITNEDIRTGAWRRDDAARLAAAPARTGEVAVPSAWVQPAAATGIDRSQDLRVAQAPAESTPGTLSDSPVPPPRFRSMEVNELPPLAPVTPAASASASESGSTATTASTARDAAGAAAVPEPRPSADGTAGFWVQLGAFGQRDGAAIFQDKVAKQMPALAGKLVVFSESGKHRLQAGPYASRDAALMLGEQVRNGLDLVPIIVERR